PAALAFASGVSAGPMGSAHPVGAPYQAFPTQDGWINIGAISQATWEGTARVLDAAWMITDERFVTNGARMQHRELLVDTMSTILKTRTTDAWMEPFEQAGVPAGPVKSMIQVLEDTQTQARGMVEEVDNPIAGTVQALGCPVKFSAGDGVTRRGAPIYGQHTAEVLSEIGLSNDEIDALAADNVIHVAREFAD